MDDLVETILQKFEFMKDKAIRLITSGLNKKKVNVSVIKAWISYTMIPYAKFGWIWSVALEKCPCNFIIPWKKVTPITQECFVWRLVKIGPVVLEKMKIWKQW